MRRSQLFGLVAAAATALAAAPASADGPAPAPSSALASEGFVQIADEHGVRVYRREKRAGIELAAEGRIGASPDRVRKVLIDYPAHQRWQKHLKENKILGRGEGFLDVYQRLDLPMIDDRDFCLHVTWGDEGPVAWMRFAATPGIGPPPVKGVVRVTQHEGGWRLEPVEGGAATHAVYRFYLDLAGSFPAWMAKGQAASDLPDLFAKVTKQLSS
jgi:hypothetical protein